MYVGTCARTCGCAPALGFGPRQVTSGCSLHPRQAVLCIPGSLTSSCKLLEALPSSLPQGLLGAWPVSAVLASELPWADLGLGRGAPLLPQPEAGPML